MAVGVSLIILRSDLLQHAQFGLGDAMSVAPQRSLPFAGNVRSSRDDWDGAVFASGDDLHKRGAVSNQRYADKFVSCGQHADLGRADWNGACFAVGWVLGIDL